MTNPQQFDEPDDFTGVRLQPANIVGHLLLVWAIEYIEHSPTIHTRPDRPSDVIVVDCVDLDSADETGAVGLLARKSWWRQAKLIQALKSKVSNPRPLLVVMTRGVAQKGFQAPFELVSMSRDPQAAQRAQQWLQQHPAFEPSKPGFPEQSASPEPFQAQTPDIWAPEPREETLLERMVKQGNQAGQSQQPYQAPTGGQRPMYNPHSPSAPLPPRPPQPDVPPY